MGNVLINQSLYLQVAKNPSQTGAPIVEIDFALNPSQALAITDFDEDATARFSVPANSSLVLGMDSVALGGFLALQVDADCGVVITNSLGSSPTLTFKAGRMSVMHMAFTGVQLVNSTGVAITGRVCIVGE
jgi:hypothetical protein